MYRKKHRERAQIMVVTAFVIALTFLLLATLLNIVIYAENQAARGITVADQAAFESHTQVNNSVTDLLKKENFNNYSRTYDQREDAFGNGTSHIFTVHKLEETKEQNLYDTEISSIDRGTRIVQDSDREYTSESNSTDWQLIASTDKTRNMTQTVERDSLYEVPNSTVWSSIYRSSNPLFETHFDAPSGTWTIYIVDEESSNSIYVRTHGPSGFYDDCRIGASRATLNYSEQTINGNDCPALDFVTDLDPTYSVEYVNGDFAEGQYHIHTSAELGSGVSAAPYNSSASRDSPYAVRSIYSVEYEQVYLSSNIRYETTTYIAPHQLEDES